MNKFEFLADKQQDLLGQGIIGEGLDFDNESIQSNRESRPWFTPPLFVTSNDFGSWCACDFIFPILDCHLITMRENLKSIYGSIRPIKF